MARSHWYFAASCAAVLAAAAVACGDSATGEEIPDPTSDGGSSGKDGGSSGGDGSVIPRTDSGTSSGNIDSGVDSGPKSDGGLPTVSVTALDFLETDCGQTAAPQKFTVSNPSAAEVSFASELVKGGASLYTVSPSTGAIPAGGSLEVTVTPKAVPVPSSTNTNAIGDTLKLTIGPTNAQIDLKQTAHGASLKLLTSGGSDFGNVPTAATGVTLPLQIANSGNATAPFTLSIVPDPAGDGGTSPFSVSSPNTSAAPGLSQATVAFQPAEVASFTGKVHLEVGAGVVLCDAPPGDLTFTGKGTDGVVTISPLAMNFGNPGVATTDCGTIAQQQTIRISNSSTKAFLVKSISLAKGTTPFALTSGSTTDRQSFSNLNVPAGGFIELIVVPKIVPANNAANPVGSETFNDKLTITTDAPGDTEPHIIELKQQPRGAYLVRSTGSLSGFGNVASGLSSQPQTFTWQNVGNVDITLNQTLAQGIDYAVAPGVLNLVAGEAPSVTSVTFSPTKVQNPITDTISVAQPPGPAVVTCNNLPANIGTTGVGTSAQLQLNNGTGNISVPFGAVSCGTAAPAGKTFKITNNGPAANYTAVLRKTTSPFTLSSAGGPIAAGASVTITATPKAIGTDIGSIADLTDVVDVTLDNPSASPNTLTVSLSVTPQGALFSFGGRLNFAFPTNQKVNTTSPIQNMTVTNNGNLAAGLVFTVNNPAGATPFAGNPPTANVQPGSGNALITAFTFTPPLAQAYSGNVTITPAAGAVLCGPLPQGQTALNGVLPMTGTGVP